MAVAVSEKSVLNPCYSRRDGICLLAAHHQEKERRNKVLFIHAVNEVTRERAQSFLTDDHIQRIVAAYQAFDNEDGFTRVASNDEIRNKGCNLSLPLYVRLANGNGNANGAGETISLKQAIANWQESSMALRESMNGLFEVLEQHTDHFPGGTKMIRASGEKSHDFESGEKNERAE